MRLGWPTPEMTNIFADFREPRRGCARRSGGFGRAAGRARFAPRRGRAAARSHAWRSLDQRRDGAGRAGEAEPVALAERSPRRSRGASCTRRYRGSGFRGGRQARFPQHPARSRIWHAQLRAILRAGPAYGDSEIGAGEHVNVEFVSANPTGPMHVGHGRGAVVGDALAALLAKAGFAVQREYYINDAGAQVDVLARSTYLRYREALGEAIGRDPRGALSRRISDRDRPRARRARRQEMARPARGGMARAAPRIRRRPR